MERYKTLRSVFSRKKYLFILLAVAFVYFGVYYLIVTYFLEGFFIFFKTYVKSYAYTAFGLNIIIAFLLGTNIALLVYRLREVAPDKKSPITSGFGIFAAALANGCPGCFAGLFPMILSVFGISATLSVLPFNGLELQALSAGLLGLSVFFLTGKPKTCKI